jgi:hypothetical protein
MFVAFHRQISGIPARVLAVIGNDVPERLDCPEAACRLLPSAHAW